MVAALIAGAAASPAAASTQLPHADGTVSSRLLDVPYFAQSEDLCGGAAIAMVLQYWGDRRAQPEDFSALVDRSAAGIRTNVLAAAVSQRGWQSFPIASPSELDDAGIGAQIERGRPMVALIAAGPSRYHYVVIVGWTREQVIAHDPARAPFQVIERAEFERAWTAAGRWALLVLPAADWRPVAELPAPPPATIPNDSACRPLVDTMVGFARRGQLAEAEPGLVAATKLCPRDAAPWRELAGLRFLQSRWAEAASLAERAATIEPADEAGWDLLATSRFLNDQPVAALGAWNRIGRPAISGVLVEGVTRTRRPIIDALLDLPSRTPLTAERLGRAARRLDELPSASLTRLRYRPMPGGLAEIDAIVVERSAFPRGVVPMAVTAARAVFQREVRAEAAALTGHGERVTVAWRWWEARPRLALTVAVPAVSWWPGITTIEGLWERQSYATPAIAAVERRRAGIRMADWASSQLRWNAGLALDRWAQQSHWSTDAGLDLRLAGDRVALGAEASAWMPTDGGRRFITSQWSSAWRSTTSASAPAWSMATGLVTASGASPFDLWPGAGTGHGRAPWLRAHPLLADGVITGEVFGRRLVHGTLEYQHPLVDTAAGGLRAALFTDAARTWHRPGSGGGSRFHADVGVGLRVAVPGNRGALRLDLARGLRDARMALSAGWQTSWPGGRRE